MHTRGVRADIEPTLGREGTRKKGGGSNEMKSSGGRNPRVFKDLEQIISVFGDTNFSL